MFDLFKELLSTASRNRLRTALTGFAVAWGILILIVLLGAGNGLINAMESNMDGAVTNSIQVWGGATSKPYDGLPEGRRTQLNDGDATATKAAFEENVDDVAGTVSLGGATFNGTTEYITGQSLAGVRPEYINIYKEKLAAGRFIDQIDITGKRKVVVISQTQARDLGIGVGDYVAVDKIKYKVVGIIATEGNDSGDEAYVPFTTFKAIYPRGDKIETLTFTFHGLSTEAQHEAFETAYKRSINRRHRAAPDDESTVWLYNRYTSHMTMEKGSGYIRLFLWIVGLFTLLSGVVGVSNIMLITVKERTREFGIRKAIGCKPAELLRMIVAESVVMTSIFGYIGMLLGIAACEYMDATLGHEVIDTGLFQTTMFVNPTVGLATCIEATAVMIVAGTLAGLIPAWKAARVRPIEALAAE